MYQWKINMVDGKSYVVKSSIKNNVDFMNELFGLNLNHIPKVKISCFELVDPKEENEYVAIISNHVVSVEWY